MKKIKIIILTSILCISLTSNNAEAGKLKIKSNEVTEKKEDDKESQDIIEKNEKIEEKKVFKVKSSKKSNSNQKTTRSKTIKDNTVDKPKDSVMTTKKTETKRKESFPPIRLSQPGVRISSMFGPRLRPTPGASSFHQGIDIAAPKGTFVYAVNDGTVVHAKSSGGSGNKIIIDHGNGVKSIYMHMSMRSVNIGDKVLGGYVVGTVGNTGISTGSHLHFEIHQNGIRKNPINIIKRK